MHKQCQQKRKEKDWGVEHQCFRPTCCGQSGWPTWCHNITLDVQVKGIFEIIHSMCCCWSWRSLETMLLVICVTMAHFDLLLAWKKKWETLEFRWHDVIELRPTWSIRIEGRRGEEEGKEDGRRQNIRIDSTVFRIYFFSLKERTKKHFSDEAGIVKREEKEWVGGGMIGGGWGRATWLDTGMIILIDAFLMSCALFCLRARNNTVSICLGHFWRTKKMSWEYLGMHTFD